jgi:hypothetical protein
MSDPLNEPLEPGQPAHHHRVNAGDTNPDVMDRHVARLKEMERLQKLAPSVADVKKASPPEAPPR